MTGAVLLLVAGALILLAVLSAVATTGQDDPGVRRGNFTLGFLLGGGTIALIACLAAGYWILRRGLPILG